MAKIGGGMVPLYQRQIQEQPMPAARMADVVDPAAFGVGGAQAMLRGAEQMDRSGREAYSMGMWIQKRAQELQKEEDHAAALDASNQFLTETNNYLYNGQTGLMTRKGRDAVGIAETAPEELRKMSKNIGSKLKNPNQQLLFGRMVGSQMNSVIGEVFRHQAKEKYVYEEQLTDSLTDNFKRTMVMTDSTDKYLEARAAMEANVRNRYEKMYGPEFVQEKLFKANSDVWLAKVNNLFVTAGAEAAMQLASSRRNEIEPVKYAVTAKELSGKIKEIHYNDLAKQFLQESGGNLQAANARLSQGVVRTPWTLLKTFGEQELGKPYKLGGDGKDFTDCGDFTQRVFGKVGVNLGSRDVSEQARLLNEGGKFFTDRAQLQPGDLVFYKNTYQPTEGHGFQNITHAGIYDGNGRILHAGSSKGVSYTTIDSPGEIAGYGRTDRKLSREEQWEVSKGMRYEKGHEDYIKATVEHDELNRIQDLLAVEKDPLKKREIIQSSNLPPRMKGHLDDAIASSRKTNQLAAMQLDFREMDEVLTDEDVDGMAKYLSEADYRKYKVAVRKIARGIVDKSKTRADQQLRDVVNQLPDRDANQKAALWHTVIEELNEQGLNGEQRLTAGRKLIDKDIESKGSMFNSKLETDTQIGSLKGIWGDLPVRLALKGVPNIAKTSAFFASLDNNAVTRKVLQMFADANEPITPEEFNRSLIRYVEAQGIRYRADRYYKPEQLVAPSTIQTGESYSAGRYGD